MISDIFSYACLPFIILKFYFPTFVETVLLWDSANFCDLLAFIFLSWQYSRKFSWGNIPSQLSDARCQMELITSLPLFWEGAKKWSLANLRIESSDHSNGFRNRHLTLAVNDVWWNLYSCCQESRFSFLLNLNWENISLKLPQLTCQQEVRGRKYWELFIPVVASDKFIE